MELFSAVREGVRTGGDIVFRQFGLAGSLLAYAVTGMISVTALPGSSSGQEESTTQNRTTQGNQTGLPLNLGPVREGAQDNGSFLLDRITVQATRSPRNILDVPANVTVIGREELDTEAITDIDKLIRKVPGVTVNRQTSGTDPFNTFSGFNIRGVGANRVQISVDGARIAERITDGPRDFISLDLTKSVDIVRGPASVLWGSDALGGLVAIETLDPEDILRPGERFGGELKTTFDTENNAWKKTAIGATSVDPAVKILLGYSNITANEPKRSRARADGGINGCPRNIAVGATPCNKFDPTDTESNSYLGKIVATPTAAHRFEFTADILDRVTEVDQRFDLGPEFSNFSGLPTGVVNLDFKRKLDLKRKRFALEHTWDTRLPMLESIKSVLSYSPQGYTRSGRRVRDEANGDRTVRDDLLKYSENFFEADLQLVSKFALGDVQHRLTYGFDGDYTATYYKRRDITNNLTTGVVTERRAGGFNFANARTTRADLFIQDEISMFDDVLEVIPAVRYATYKIDPRPDSDYEVVIGKEPRKITEEALTFKLGATLNLNANYSLYGQFSQGFKMPTAEQLFTSLPGTFFNLIPAPDLRPEKVDSYELGLRGRFPRGQFSANVFYADYTDFIQAFFFVPGTTDITFRNLSSVQLYGVEASAEFELLDNLIGYGALSYQRGNQKASPDADKEAFNAATPLNGIVGLKYLFEEHDLEVDVSSIWSAAVKRQNRDNRFKPDAYAVFDVNSAWRPTSNIEVTASVLNLFNSRYFRAPLSFDVDASDAVARVNPLELQTQPGRTFRIGARVTF